MRDDDRDDPFDEFFDEIERMMNEMMGSAGNFHVDRPDRGANRSAGADAERDVHLDVHETEDTVRVVADIPGVRKEDIDLTCDGTTLDITAEGDTRDYRERVELPSRVDELSASATYNNGVLEVSFDRIDDATDIDL